MQRPLLQAFNIKGGSRNHGCNRDCSLYFMIHWVIILIVFKYNSCIKYIVCIWIMLNCTSDRSCWPAWLSSFKLDASACKVGSLRILLSLLRKHLFLWLAEARTWARTVPAGYCQNSNVITKRCSQEQPLCSNHRIFASHTDEGSTCVAHTPSSRACTQMASSIVASNNLISKLLWFGGVQSMQVTWYVLTM